MKKILLAIGIVFCVFCVKAAILVYFLSLIGISVGYFKSLCLVALLNIITSETKVKL